MKKKVTKTEITETYQNGEKIVDKIKSTGFLVDSEPEYVKLYIRDIGRLNEINGKANDILFSFISSMGYNNIIPTYKPIKQMIARDLNVSLSTVESAVKLFKKRIIYFICSRNIYSRS